MSITVFYVVKERLAALWRDFLRVFFNIPTHYLYSHTAALATSNLRNFSQQVQSQILLSEDGASNLVPPDNMMEDGIQNINAAFAKYVLFCMYACMYV